MWGEGWVVFIYVVFRGVIFISHAPRQNFEHPVEPLDAEGSGR